MLGTKNWKLKLMKQHDKMKKIRNRKMLKISILKATKC